MKKYIKPLLWVFAYMILFIMIALESSSSGEYLAYLIAAVMGIPFALFAFLILCICVYNWLFHGNPFYEESCTCHPRVLRSSFSTDAPRKARMKYCAVCKRDSRCHLTRSKTTGTWIHVMR